ncbi:MAG: LysR family transcriptional regulator [Rhodobacter sp.]|uniref:LysR family transcriptional regulator n=1 Tax=Pararhodobacter sp. TaxID=2127056 RepID=UPI001E079568|nr:LysR family transcriptional regulator [Pararhodobacter sp.]MCB1344092.1 LysR family transcriptional regulator [Paracoccaceae bacterium]MCC0071654.1 LysR family transcriptional regulator [Rhodobacter sp.]HPD93461.1 LysR family transcriptional regulator [Pararhodobacter sp.]
MTDSLPNLRHMRVFLETVRTGSVSGAADRCGLSQPAATQALARLESEVGTPLLARRTRQFAPTPCGALFVRRVEAALAHLHAGARAALRGARESTRRAAFDHLVTAAQIRALVAVSGSGSFTIAARHLGLAQPTVHRAARSLEEVAGVPFFLTTATGVELTPAAQAFTLGAKLAQAEIRQGFEEIGRELGDDRGTFTLGSLPLARTTIVPRATHALIAATQGVQVRVVDGRYPELLRSLREGDLDCLIGALRTPPPAEDVTQEPLFEDALVIVAHPSHPLAGRANLRIEDTLAYPWVAPPKTTPAGSYLFETLRIDQRPRTPVRVVASSLVFLRGLLAQGDYISIISRHQIATEIRDGHIAPLDIALTGGSRDIGLTYRSSWRPTATQARLLALLRAAIP